MKFLTKLQRATLVYHVNSLHPNTKTIMKTADPVALNETIKLILSDQRAYKPLSLTLEFPKDHQSAPQVWGLQVPKIIAGRVEWDILDGDTPEENTHATKQFSNDSSIRDFIGDMDGTEFCPRHIFLMFQEV